jgi:hypothetical protein
MSSIMLGYNNAEIPYLRRQIQPRGATEDFLLVQELRKLEGFPSAELPLNSNLIL